MNRKVVDAEIKKAGRMPVYSFTVAEPMMGVVLKGGKKAVWGLLPIDDESDVRFAQFLVREAQKAELQEEAIP